MEELSHVIKSAYCFTPYFLLFSTSLFSCDPDGTLFVIRSVKTLYTCILWYIIVYSACSIYNIYCIYNITLAMKSDELRLRPDAGSAWSQSQYTLR